MKKHTPLIRLGLLTVAFTLTTHSPGQAEDGANPRFHGPVIQWHRDPTTSATFSWVERPTSIDLSNVGWKEGPSGFGYEGGDDATLLDQMEGNFTRIYIAKSFSLKEKPDKNTKLILEVDYDDGFIAYLNGQEIARSKTVKGSHDKADVSSHESGEPETFEIEAPAKILKAGPNLISIEGHNRSLSSSDMTLIPRLLIDKKVIIESGDDWLYLAGRDPDSKWYLRRPELPKEDKDSPAKSTNWKLEVQPREKQADPQNPITTTLTTVPFWTKGSLAHRTIVEGLLPHEEYQFTLTASGKTVRKGWFRTAPSQLDHPYTFVVGGDMGTKAAIPICKLAAQEDVDFAYLGGDLAYANGRDIYKWYDWIDNWTHLVTREDGRHLPMVAAIGNHETREHFTGTTLQRAPFYYSLFDLPNEGRSNFSVDFGKYLSLICLDSDHTQKVADQTEWLRQALEKRAQIPHVFPIYHRPAWGTGVKSNSKPVQEEWTPLFQQYQVACVFENDHHVYKRTWKITNGKRDKDRGILHIGDGAWGASPREITAKHIKNVNGQNYLAKWQSINHLVRVTIHPDGKREYIAKIADGSVIDSYNDK